MLAFVVSDTVITGQLTSGWPPETLLSWTDQQEGSGVFHVLRRSKLTCLEADLAERLRGLGSVPLLWAVFIMQIHFLTLLLLF